MVASCSIGNGATQAISLDSTSAVGRTADKGVRACLRGCPLPCPHDPGILRQWRLQRCLMPCQTTIGTYLNFLNATVARKFDTANLYRLLDRSLVAWMIDAA